MSSSFVDGHVVHEEDTSDERYGTCPSEADPDPNHTEDVDLVDHKAEISTLTDENDRLKVFLNEKSIHIYFISVSIHLYF